MTNSKKMNLANKLAQWSSEDLDTYLNAIAEELRKRDYATFGRLTNCFERSTLPDYCATPSK